MKQVKATEQAQFDKAQQLYVDNKTDASMRILTRLELMPSFANMEPSLQMKTLSLKGLGYYSKGEYTQAEEYLLRSLKIALQIGDPKAIYIRYENLAAIYVSENKHQQAIDFLQKSIDLKESTGNPADIPRSLIQLSALQFTIENNLAAQATVKKARSLINKYKLTDLYTTLHFSLAMMYKKVHKFNQALREYDACIKHAHLKNDYLNIAKAYNNQGTMYWDMGQPDIARQKFMESIRFSKLANAQTMTLLSNVQLARISLQLNDIPECRRAFEYVQSKIHQTEDPLVHKDLADLEVHLLEVEGDYRGALSAYRKYVAYYKKSYDNELSRAVVDIQAKYESEKNERELQKANLRQVESELKALRAQMDPHFIFNALGSLRREILEGNIENADMYLVRFSKLLRMILDTSRKPMVQLSENIELLHLYIQIENSRQGNRFDYKIEVKGLDPATIYIPGLILQPLAENAIVHGLNPKKKGRGRLNILFSKSGKTLKITVSDNGIGRQAARDKAKENHTSHAMNIIKETLDLVWKDKKATGFFAVKDLQGPNNISKGTEVTILLPLPV